MSPKKAGAEKEGRLADVPHQEEHKDSRKDDHKGDEKQTSKDNKNDDQKSANKQSQKDSHKVDLQDDHHDAPSPAAKDVLRSSSLTSARRPSTANILKELIRRRHSEGLLFAPQTRRHSLGDDLKWSIPDIIKVFKESGSALKFAVEAPKEEHSRVRLFLGPFVGIIFAGLTAPAPSELAASTQHTYAPWDAPGGVPRESGANSHDGANASYSYPYPTIGTCSCHPACNCRKPCQCEPPPCPCKGPIVKDIRGAGSGSVVSTMVPIPVPLPMPGYNDGRSSGCESFGNKGSNEPIVINPYPPPTTPAHLVTTPPTQHPPEPHGIPPTSVHELTSLMKTLMMNRIRDDLLKQWGVQAPTLVPNAHDPAASTAVAEVRSPAPAVQSEAVPAPSRIAHRTAVFDDSTVQLRSYAAEREDDESEPPPRLTAVQRRPSVAPRILKPMGRRIP